MANPNVTITDFSYWTEHLKNAAWAAVPAGYVYYNTRDALPAAITGALAFGAGILAESVGGVTDHPTFGDNRAFQRVAEGAIVGAPLYVQWMGSGDMYWKVPASAIAAWAAYKEYMLPGYVTDMFERKQ